MKEKMSEGYFKALDALEFADIYIPPFDYKQVEIDGEKYISKTEFSNLLESILFRKMECEIITHIFDLNISKIIKLN